MAPPISSRGGPSRVSEAAPASRNSLRLPKVKKSSKAPTFDTYDDCMDAGVEAEEKGEKFRAGDKSQRFYEQSLALYERAARFELTFDAMYNRARVLYILGTSFHIPPRSIEMLKQSIELYHECLQRTEDPYLLADARFNLARAILELVDLVADGVAPPTSLGPKTIADWRNQASEALQEVERVQEAYLTGLSSTSDDNEPGSEATTGATNNAEEYPADLEDEGGEGDGDMVAYERQMPTWDALLETLLLMIEVRCDAWRDPSTGHEHEESTLAGLLEMATSVVGRMQVGSSEQNNAHWSCVLAEIGIWRTFREVAGADHRDPASVQADRDRLLGYLNSIQQGNQLARPMPSDVDIKRGLEMTQIDVLSDLAGISGSPDEAWKHLSTALTVAATAVETGSSTTLGVLGAGAALTPAAIFQANLLNASSALSLRRALLAQVSFEPAKKNLKVLLANAQTFANKALSALNWSSWRSDTATSSIAALGYPAGWEVERIGRTAALHLLRTLFYAAEAADAVDPSQTAAIRQQAQLLVQRLTRGVRTITKIDVHWYLEDLEEEEGRLSSKELVFWEQAL